MLDERGPGPGELSVPRAVANARWPAAARGAPVVVALISLGIYLRTLLPGLAFGDWGEMQTVPHVLGVAHPTGYPTYILIAWLFELIPVGSVAFRANLLSAVCVAIALATVTAIVQRIGGRPLIASIAALATGAIGTVWAASSVAEVNPLHLVFVTLIIHRALVWEARPTNRTLAVGAILTGLALGNHLLILFVAPFVAVFVLWTGRRELHQRPRWLSWFLVALLVGLSVYAYIPIAASFSPPLPYNHPLTFDAVRWLVTGEQFRGQYSGLLTLDSVGLFFDSLPELWRLALARATVVIPLAGLAGLGILAVRRPAFGLACWGILVTGIYVWANYLRLEHYLLVPWLILGIGAAVALESAARGAERLRPVRLARLVLPGTVVAGGAFAIALVALNLPGADRSSDRSADAYVDALFDALPPNAAIISYWDASTPLWHARFVEGRRPDVLVVDDTNIVYEGWDTRERRIDSLICERPVFIQHLGGSELALTQAVYRLEPLLTVKIGSGGTSATYSRAVNRVVPPPGRCP